MADKLKVYVETSFVCYLTGDQTLDAKIAADQAYTRQWWKEERSSCDVVASRFVFAEASVGKPDAVARRLDILKEIDFVRGDDDVVEALARQLIEGHALPEKETTDALHIAAAAMVGVDVLLTWNCRHMANPHTLPRTREILQRAGFNCPQVMTPKTFLDNRNMEG